jgi:hypothetical protein
MKLFELFGHNEKNKDPRLDPEINYIEDLKFFIDNDNQMLSKVFFPAIKSHQDNGGYDDDHEHYVEPIKKAIVIYCKAHDLSDIKDEIFDEASIHELAKKCAAEQHKHIHKGDYQE